MSNAFLPVLLLHSFDFPEAVNDLVLEFLIEEMSDDLIWVIQLVWDERVELAQYVVRHRVRAHFRRFESDILRLR